MPIDAVPCSAPATAAIHDCMRIDCPTCSAAYDVPPERVPPGRTVKCARCGESWTPVADTVPAAADTTPDLRPVPASPSLSPPSLSPPSLPPPNLPPPNLIERSGVTMLGAAVGEADSPGVASPAPPPAPIEPAPARDGARMPLVAAWCLSALVLAGLAWMLVVRRAEIMQAWPPSQRAYAAVGLAAAGDHAPERR